ncbi:class II fumarate hydratase, partial [Deferribacter abyssi]|uniref:class II fumarate hydratase n=1 Tax=Deferribacter abyssi TaxID=213806 RepID=UPI003C299605
MNFREEKDSMGIIKVPEKAYYGAQTVRAMDNFKISGKTLPLEFIYAVVEIKKGAAIANCKLGLISEKLANAIVTAANEIIGGKFNDQFPLDIFQTGSGTSTNMNVNEVIANRACELLGGQKGDKILCHPNDHVNKGQSSNDVIPSAIHISSVLLTDQNLIPALSKLERSLLEKEKEFADIIKIGRTHLMDAVPMTLGQEFSGYRIQIKKALERIKESIRGLLDLPLGGTAVGTGINTHPDFAKFAIDEINKNIGKEFKQAENLFEVIAAKDAIVYFAGALNTLAVSLMKIANDLRLLNSGPRCGIAEITLPSLQPGSSIMPGKVNPVIPEAVIQVSAEVMGNVHTISIAGSSGLLDLNVMMPVIADNLLSSIKLLSNAISSLAEKCIDGIVANVDRCNELVDWSMALVTP